MKINLYELLKKEINVFLRATLANKQFYFVLFEIWRI